MLPRKNRIPRKDFPAGVRQGSSNQQTSHQSRVWTRGLAVKSRLFSVVVHPSTTGVRVSVVVSKKTAKSAVARNTLRRRMYVAITPFLKELSREALIVLYPKAEAKQAPFSVLQKEIETALRQAKLAK